MLNELDVVRVHSFRCVAFARLSELRSVLQGLITESILESEMLQFIRTYGSDLQRFLSTERLKCSGSGLEWTYLFYKASNASDSR